MKSAVVVGSVVYLVCKFVLESGGYSAAFGKQRRSVAFLRAFFLS